MDKSTVIIGIAAVIGILFIISPAIEVRAGLSEPGVMLYGQVTDETGALITSGTLVWSFAPEGSETPVVTTNVQLEAIEFDGIAYSYRTLLPMETAIQGHPPTANTIQLANNEVSYAWTASVEEHDIASSGMVDLGYADCGTGRYIAIGPSQSVDTDNDGLPDDWELLYLLDPESDEGDHGQSGDPDNDGLSNLEEYLNGTDPLVADIVLPNTSPSAPSLNAPADGTEVASLQPVLSVNNADDPDADEITYEFEVYSDQGLTSLIAASSEVAEGTNVSEMALPGGLSDNTLYYWRARAFDGTENSPWMDVATFFINTENDPPGIPVLSYPRDGSGIAALQATLVVKTVSDPDRDMVTYEFAVYSDAELTSLVEASDNISGAAGSDCIWTMNVELTDGETYYWTARAVDDEGAQSTWVAANDFSVDTANGSPVISAIASPAQGERITEVPPVLSVTNGSDPDGDTLVYEFQIDSVDTFDGPDLEASMPIDQGVDGETSWMPLSDLDENTTYFWRVCAYDGAAYSLWIQGSFFVNTQNSTPSVPGILNPGNGSSVSELAPTLSVVPAFDEDNDTLTYDYEVYTGDDPQADTLVVDVLDAGTAWQVATPLANRTSYSWRVRAVDEIGAAGPWSETAAFTVNVNTRPTTPTLNNPVSGGMVTSLTPVLSVLNAEDPDGDPLFYDFELYSDIDLQYRVAGGTIGEDTLITSWTVPVDLSDNTSYYWRARGLDGILESPWTPTAVFTVDTDGADTVLNTEISVLVSADSPDDQVVEVTDGQSPIHNVAVIIPPGALAEDCTVTIAWVENPPALPGGAIALGKVLEFGPHGTTFSNPVTIEIPYTEADLVTAGVSDPTELSVLTYDPASLTWEPIPVSSVDTGGGFLVISVIHFSIYTKGAISDSDPSSDDDDGSGGSDGCFVNSALERPGTGSVRAGLPLIIFGVMAAVGLAVRRLIQCKSDKL